MSRVELPESRPSLRLIISILDQKNSIVIDWFLRYLISEELSQSSDTLLLNSVYHEAAKLFIEDIKIICESVSPEVNPVPLEQYLTQGRGLLLLAGLQRVVSRTSVFNEELSAILLSLESVLDKSDVATELNQDQNILDPATVPKSRFSHEKILTKRKQKSSRTRRRAVR